MSKTTILYCESNSDGTIGGSFYSLLFLVEALDPQRFRRIVVFYQDHSLIPRYQEAGVEVIVLEPPKPMNLSQWMANPIARLLKPAVIFLQKSANAIHGLVFPTVACARLLKREQVDLIHLNNSVTRNHAWMIAARLNQIPCITHERGINSSYSALSKRLAGGLDAIICISKAVRRCLEEHGVGSDNWQVIYNGLDPERISVTRSTDEIRLRLNIADDRPIIGIVGNIKEWKGQETVVQAVELLKESYPDLACLLVGDTSPDDFYYEQRLRARVAETGLENNVIFAGYQRNVGDLIHLMDVVIHASIEPEPFGRVLLEAMAMRKPVIGARAGAVPEIIDEGITGMTFEPGNAVELAACVATLLQAPDKAAMMGNAGYERLVRQFHITRNVERTLGLYAEVLNRPRNEGVQEVASEETRKGHP